MGSRRRDFLMKRKWICTLLAASMALSLCACTADKPAEPTPTPAEAVTPTPEPEEIYIVRMDSTLFRSSPESGTDNVLGAVNKGTEAALLDEDGDFLQVRLPDPGGQVLRRGAPAVGLPVPLRQAAVALRPRQQHRQDAHGEHPQKQQHQQATHIRFSHSFSHGSFSNTVMSGIRLEANTV